MILSKKIRISSKTKNKNYFLNKGYIENNGYFIVKVEDLKENSHYKIKVKCDICCNEKELSYYKYKKNINNGGYYSCSQKCSINKMKNTNLEKYGNECVLLNNEIKLKWIKTNLEKYNCKYVLMNKNIIEKIKKTNFKKYGEITYLNTDKSRIKLKEYFIKNKNQIQEKTKNTNLKKYGVDNPNKSKIIRDKINKTNLEKYGHSCPLHNKEIKKKTEKTNLEKFGFITPLKNNNIRNKITKTKILNFKKRYNDLNIIDIDFTNNIIKIKCDKCNKIYEIDDGQLIDRYKRKYLNICTLCNPINSYSKSNDELQLLNFIKENYKGKIQENKRNVISPYELDIYLPNLKLAFEFNGIYWHNELFKDKNYHKNKTDLCEKKGIQLIQIFEDDWNFKQDIIKSIILNKLDKSPNNIFSHKCEIKEIYNKEIVRNFLEENHIQGFIDSTYKIGLFYKEELISLMIFGKRKDNKIELLRFCNKKNINVLGAVNKLFKYFIEKYDFKKIISYVDRAYSNGSVYKLLNFNKIKVTDSNYFYVHGNIRKHKSNFKKLIRKGYDKNKSDHEIMLENKIYRIYDSGMIKFEFKKINSFK